MERDTKVQRKIEILTMVHDLISLDENFRSGICSIVCYLNVRQKISSFEYNLILDFIMRNKPKPDNEYSEFFHNKLWIDCGYWWKDMHDNPQAKIIRKEYLTKLISNLK